MTIRPMLAARLESLTGLTYPLLASPKLDGIRAVVINGVVMSRTMKPIPNHYVQHQFGRKEYNGLDGELILGLPTAPDAFRATTSAVMTHEGEPAVNFFAFDNYLIPAPFAERLECVQEQVVDHPLLHAVAHTPAHSEQEITILEEAMLRAGYEGLMLRHRFGTYKQGRSTLREMGLMKLKRFNDSEAVVISVVEKLHNDNVAKADERGYMKRSSHQENMRPAGVLGALSVRDITTGVEFEIGTGFDDALRAELWANPPFGKVVKYKFFPSGSKDKPRFPVFVGFRNKEDM